MASILDNPIWNALSSGSESHALGNDRVKYMQRDKGLFVGFHEYTENAWRDLDDWFSVGDSIILFTPSDTTIPISWAVKINRPLHQMVFESTGSITSGNDPRAIPLTHDDVPQMLSITSLTNPGPFFINTIKLGYYEGIFEKGRLVAMTGQRLQPEPYVEVSAVCTHLDFQGKGYAAELLRNQIQSILGQSKIPFLHVNSDNFVAIRLYEKLGFRLRREMKVYFLKKIS